MSQIEEVKSKKLESVVYRGGISTRKPSVVTFAVDHKFAVDVSQLFEDAKAGVEREEGLVALKLVAVYRWPEENLEEPKIEQKITDEIIDSEIEDEDIAPENEEEALDNGDE